MFVVNTILLHQSGSFSHITEQRLENVPDALKQMANDGVIIAGTVGELYPLIELCVCC